ncbi:hypothetical protein PLESTB_001525000 [Pleodorina starrii]|uniref:U3 small nucleolar RNA-associated protein 6 n=1 Tax=Pleodorina starrii TaxID=330485 RepID=A0A9W6BXL6_9CHLO|nr:hypothetical protein PLESTM_001168800 [Pleodorina starrii]GLC59707.1 hypothetical protein PLESTB_001525000 [Pleodorina starrii]GLC75371.1 hypothetical protein PLESTF_001628900 [Pleodorina starrii]
MADTVQYLMEQMIPELEDLERKGYFSRAEIKKIVQKRQHFEYLLKRRAALKEDYYRYVEFETKLEELRQSRKQKLKIKGKKSLAEVSIVRRIHFIYERAGRKFRSDLSLWLRWIEVCKRFKSTKQLSKVITKALQRHATVSELWIEAARWEFDTNNDIAAARSLMQQGLRMCKTDETIWVQYYHLELLNALKLRVRRRVLGLDDPAASKGDNEAGDESAAAVRAVMQGGVARIVYKNAIAAFPGRLAFRARFLRVLHGFDYSFVEGLLDQVYDSIRQDFGKSEEAWDLLARRHLDFPAARNAARTEEAEAEAAERQLQQPDQQGTAEAQPADPMQSDEEARAGADADQQPQAWDAEGHERTCAVYEEGLAAAPTSRMYLLFSSYLCATLEGLLGLGPAALQPAVAVAAQLFGLLQRAHSSGCSSPQTYLTWADWADKVKQPKMALKAARKGCERFPSDVSMWRRRLQLELAQGAGRGGEQAAQELMATFEAALRATSPEQTCEVWLMAIETLPGDSREFGRLGELLAATCAKVAKKAPTGGLGQVAAALVEKARAALGLEAARELYGKLLAMPAPGADLYRCAIRLEREAATDGATDGAAASGSGSGSRAPAKAVAKRLGDLFEAAVAAYGGTEADMWLDYALWLTECGKGAGQVYWRATKQLADPDVFIAQYREALQ